MTERIDEAQKMLRRWLGTTYERAALAYLAAQVEIAKRQQREMPLDNTNRRRNS